MVLVAVLDEKSGGGGGGYALVNDRQLLKKFVHYIAPVKSLNNN